MRENYGKNEEKIYATSAVKCDCTYYCNHHAPCRHILLKREHDKLPVFEPSTFHQRYLKKIGPQPELQLPKAEEFLAEFADVHITEETDKEGHKDQVLDVRQKYNIILPVALQIASLASNHGTNQFFEYLSSLKTMENLVRVGKNLKCLTVQEISDLKSSSCPDSTPPPNHVPDSTPPSDHGGTQSCSTSTESTSTAPAVNGDEEAVFRT